MSDTAIRIDGIAKRFTLGDLRSGYGTLRESLATWIPSLAGGKQPTTPASSERRNTTLWALQDVSFEVKRGEVVGVIGGNGAGKSTLLKVLSRITEPTSGTIQLFGKVGSLLEVGTGFHPELSGRDNIYLNGAILGMGRAEIARRFDEIVAFAEVERFLDTPVKRYSSGMYMRLAFAVAAHLDSDILLVDEVLAVGDAGFQRKCLGKMKDVSHKGRTVLFVSHNMQAVSTLTSRCVVLDRGRCVFNGATREAIEVYLGQNGNNDFSYTAAPRDGEASVTRVELRTSAPNNIHRHGDALDVMITVHTPFAISDAAVSFQVISDSQQPIIHAWVADGETPLARAPGVYTATCHIPKARLYMGCYRLSVYFSEYFGGRRFDMVEHICPFEVVMHGIPRSRPWFPGTCTYLEDTSWTVTPTVDAPDKTLA